MPSLFGGTDELICKALRIQRRKQLKNRSLRTVTLSDEGAICLVRGLYERIAGNIPARIASRSQQLWHCRRATCIADHNPSQEIVLEKTVTKLAEYGHMPGWFNQCPVASGVAGPCSDRRRAVDLVHLSGGTARLIELKWASDTPVHALFQILEYGLAYILARLHTKELGLDDRPLMHVNHVGLEVAGPRAFFAGAGWPSWFAVLAKALAGFAEQRSGGAWSMSLKACSFPEEFDRVPFTDGSTLNAAFRTGRLTVELQLVRDAFFRLAPAPTMPRRFLPGVPGAAIERLFDAAPGDEIGRGKFDHPESSAALAANAFGFFLHRAQALPPLPGCPVAAWPARSLSIEATVRFPWRGGRHPVLDCLLATASELIGIESKRFEPFRRIKAGLFSDAYWRHVWGARMKGYEHVRDMLRRNPRSFAFLDAAQLVKHAFALRSEVHRPGIHRGLDPVLFYVYAEPECWPETGHPIDDAAKAGHSDDIARFARLVANDEVAFLSCPWWRLLDAWRHDCGEGIRIHAEAVMARFSP